MFQCTDPTEAERLREAVEAARGGGLTLALATQLQALGASLVRDNGHAEALPLLQEAATIARAAGLEAAPVLIGALQPLFTAARALQRMPLALAALRELNAVRADLLAAGDRSVVAALGEGLMTEALMAGSAGDAAAALAAVDRVVALRREEAALAPGKPADLGLADALSMLASQRLDAGDPAGAAPLVEEALSLLDGAAGPGEPTWQKRVIPLTLKARIAEAGGDAAAAVAAVEEAIGIQQVPPGPHADMAAYSRARLFERLAGLRLAGGDAAGAAAAIGEARGWLGRAMRLPEPVRSGLAATLDGLTSAITVGDDPDGARSLHAGAVATLEGLAGRMKESERRQALAAIETHWTAALRRRGDAAGAARRRPARPRKAG